MGCIRSYHQPRRRVRSRLRSRCASCSYLRCGGLPLPRHVRGGWLRDGSELQERPRPDRRNRHQVVTGETVIRFAEVVPDGRLRTLVGLTTDRARRHPSPHVATFTPVHSPDTRTRNQARAGSHPQLPARALLLLWPAQQHQSPIGLLPHLHISNVIAIDPPDLPVRILPNHKLAARECHEITVHHALISQG